MSYLFKSHHQTKHLLYHGDVYETISLFKDNSFDLIISDPPYNIIPNSDTKLPKILVWFYGERGKFLMKIGTNMIFQLILIYFRLFKWS